MAMPTPTLRPPPPLAPAGPIAAAVAPAASVLAPAASVLAPTVLVLAPAASVLAPVSPVPSPLARPPTPAATAAGSARHSPPPCSQCRTTLRQGRQAIPGLMGSCCCCCSHCRQPWCRRHSHWSCCRSRCPIRHQRRVSHRPPRAVPGSQAPACCGRWSCGCPGHATRKACPSPPGSSGTRPRGNAQSARPLVHPPLAVRRPFSCRPPCPTPCRRSARSRPCSATFERRAGLHSQPRSASWSAAAAPPWRASCRWRRGWCACA
mmetsp:Transcript_102956/g.307546  ORF Transcript_102956/g.307546 Transcript_102956/m.307546 type:complete len:263 (+) Transcript_102956:943-1731(+)